MYINPSEPTHDRVDGKDLFSDVSDQDDDCTLIHMSWHSSFGDHDFCVGVGDSEKRRIMFIAVYTNPSGLALHQGATILVLDGLEFCDYENICISLTFLCGTRYMCITKIFSFEIHF